MALGSGIRNQASGVKMFFLRNFFYTFKKKKFFKFYLWNTEQNGTK